MARRRTSPMEDVIVVASKLPWWLSLLLALVSYVVLHSIASRPVVPKIVSPAQMGDAAAHGLITTLAMFGQYVMVFIFIMAALLSCIKALKNKKRSYVGEFAGTVNSELVVSRPMSRSRLGAVDPLGQFPSSFTLPEAPTPESLPETTLTTESPRVWTESILKEIEWKRFETVTKEFLNMTGYLAQETKVGADGGVDIRITKQGNSAFQGIVQCKAWNAYKVGVKPVRELFGIMAAEKVAVGMLISSGTFTAEAEDFAKGKVVLIPGWKFLEHILKLSEENRQRLLEIALEGDYQTPTCPQCDLKMTLREVKSGKNSGSKFWGCVRYPRCRQTFVC